MIGKKVLRPGPELIDQRSESNQQRFHYTGEVVTCMTDVNQENLILGEQT
jgi:hypothetical protein